MPLMDDEGHLKETHRGDGKQWPGAEWSRLSTSTSTNGELTATTILMMIMILVMMMMTIMPMSITANDVNDEGNYDDKVNHDYTIDNDDNRVMHVVLGTRKSNRPNRCA